MTKGSIVRFGWYYRRQPIHDIEKEIGIIVSDLREGVWCTTEKLYMRKGSWFIKYTTGPTEAYNVLINEKIKVIAKKNLVEVRL